MSEPTLLQQRLAEELERYGIDHPGAERLGAGGLEGLLRHIYANRDMALAFNKLAIERGDAIRKAALAAGEELQMALSLAHKHANSARDPEERTEPENDAMMIYHHVHVAMKRLAKGLGRDEQA